MEIQHQKWIKSLAKDYYKYCLTNGHVIGYLREDSRTSQAIVSIAKKIDSDADYIIMVRGWKDIIYRIKEDQEIWYNIYETTENNL